MSNDFIRQRGVYFSVLKHTKLMSNYDFQTMAEKPHRKILSIDLKSFYASVECVDRGLDPFVTPLVVADRSRGPGTIVLAVSPYLKTLGLPSRLRIYDLPPIENLIFAVPRMRRYLEVSAEVVRIFLDFACEEDIYVYSIDESFLDVTNYLDVKKYGVRKYAEKIIKKIHEDLGLTVTVGIGENIFMAKAAMDIEAKHSPDYIAEWTYDDIPEKLWPVKPLSKMWGIGKRLEKRLNDWGFFAVGDIASGTTEFLHGKLGIIGDEIYNHAHGIDYADIHEKYIPNHRSLEIGQVLLEDYSSDEATFPLKEMIEELVIRLQQDQTIAGTVGLYCGYTKRQGGGFSGNVHLGTPTGDEQIIREAIIDIFWQKVDSGKKIRTINIQATDLISAKEYQMDLFTNPVEFEKRRSLADTIAKIRHKYGDDKITKVTSADPKSNFRKRHNEIGGHRK